MPPALSANSPREIAVEHSVAVGLRHTLAQQTAGRLAAVAGRLQATTWRVRRHSATQTHRLFSRSRTNEHSSSSSKTSSPFAAGARVRSRGARLLAFFEPAGKGVARDAEEAAEAAQGGALVVSAQDLFFAGRIVGGSAGVSHEGTSAGAAAITLLAFPGVSMADSAGAIAMVATGGLCHRIVCHV